jgi:hypothetical protein
MYEGGGSLAVHRQPEGSELALWEIRHRTDPHVVVVAGDPAGYASSTKDLVGAAHQIYGPDAVSLHVGGGQSVEADFHLNSAGLAEFTEQLEQHMPRSRGVSNP